MSNLNLLDDDINDLSINENNILALSKKIQVRVFVLTFIFATLAILSIFVLVYLSNLLITNSHDMDIIYALIYVVYVLFASIFLGRDFFSYWRSLRENNDKPLIFKARYVVWVTLVKILVVTSGYSGLMFLIVMKLI